MSVSQEFTNALEEKDIITVRIMFKNSLIVDPTFEDFKQMCKEAEKILGDDLYDEHDGEKLKNNSSEYTKDYMNRQMVIVLNNFSKERLEKLKEICGYIYKDYADKKREQQASQNTSHNINTKNSTSSSSNRNRGANTNTYSNKTYNRQKEIGIGVAVVGVGLVISGLIVAKTIAIVAGTTTAIVGGIIIATKK